MKKSKGFDYFLKIQEREGLFGGFNVGVHVRSLEVVLEGVNSTLTVFRSWEWWMERQFGCEIEWLVSKAK